MNKEGHRVVVQMGSPVRRFVMRLLHDVSSATAAKSASAGVRHHALLCFAAAVLVLCTISFAGSAAAQVEEAVPEKPDFPLNVFQDEADFTVR